jgi:hypothetical protein
VVCRQHLPIVVVVVAVVVVAKWECVRELYEKCDMSLLMNVDVVHKHNPTQIVFIILQYLYTYKLNTVDKYIILYNSQLEPVITGCVRFFKYSKIGKP